MEVMARDYGQVGDCVNTSPHPLEKRNDITQPGVSPCLAYTAQLYSASKNVPLFWRMQPRIRSRPSSRTAPTDLRSATCRFSSMLNANCCEGTSRVRTANSRTSWREWKPWRSFTAHMV